MGTTVTQRRMDITSSRGGCGHGSDLCEAEPHDLHLNPLLQKIETRSLLAGVVGLGYVGLPLAQLFISRGFRVLGLDINQNKTGKLMRGESYIGHIPSSMVRQMRANDRLVATSDFSCVSRADTLSICVPTLLDKARQPDLTAVRNTTESLVPHLRPGQLVVLESTTYPGATSEVVLPILRRSGLKIGEEIFVAYSPEREDPANPHFTARTIPKVVGANDSASRRAIEAFYGAAFDRIVPVSSCEAAGGHCIPIDPFYLSWKAREYDFATRFIELAGEVNTEMPYNVVTRVAEHLNARGIPTSAARLLVLGLAYKKNVDDCRESPPIKILKLLADRGIDLSCFDPHVSGYVSHRYGALPGVELPELSDVALGAADATLILTDHDAFDYERIVRLSAAVIDTRNATRNVAADRDKVNLA